MEKKKEKFNKKVYDIEYRKKNKKQFNVDLNISEYEHLTDLLLKNNLSKVQFIRNAIIELEKEKP